MSDTLHSLREEARRGVAKRETDALVLRTWKAALDSVRGRTPPELVGCGDHSCVVASPKGMGTNGGCRCDEQALRRAVNALKQQRQCMLARKGKAVKDATPTVEIAMTSRAQDLETLERIPWDESGPPNFGAPGYAALARQLAWLVRCGRFVEEHGRACRIAFGGYEGPERNDEAIGNACAALDTLRSPNPSPKEGSDD